jgi:hypothetical protein
MGDGDDITMSIPIHTGATSLFFETCVLSGFSDDSSVWVGTTLGSDNIGCDDDSYWDCPGGLASTATLNVAAYVGSTVYMILDEYAVDAYWDELESGNTVLIRVCPPPPPPPVGIDIGTDTTYTVTTAATPTANCTRSVVTIMPAQPAWPTTDLAVYPGTACTVMGSGGDETVIAIPLPAGTTTLNFSTCLLATGSADSSIWIGSTVGADNVGCDDDSGTCTYGAYSSDGSVNVSAWAGTTIYMVVDEYSPDGFWDEFNTGNVITIDRCT